MKKFNNLVKMFTGFAAISTHASDSIATEQNSSFNYINDIETAPVNTGELPIYLAGHRSHSSHASHGSHRSSSGGSYKAPVRSTPSPSSHPTQSPSDPLGQPARPKSTIPISGESKLKTIMSDSEKRKNIILRVQLTLQALNFYSGNLDGIMGSQTRKALNNYRASVGQNEKETLDIEVLNSLGILVQ